MSQPESRQFRLIRRPVGLPKRDDFEYRVEPARKPEEGEIMVGVEYISLDPAMRGWMNEGKSYIKPVGLGEVMRAGAVGTIIESRAAGFAAGDVVTGPFGVQSVATIAAKDCLKVDPSLAPKPLFISTLGMPGMTAYFGLLAVGEPKAGETVVVSAAAGAVGALVGQIAKIQGCRVVGIAGREDKCRYIVDELGFDAAIDYKSESVPERLRETCPNGIDVYFDNVGGQILDDCLARINLRARIVICGAISQYNSTTPVRGPANYLSLLVNRARMQGMIVFDWADRYPEGMQAMAGWLRQGKLKSREDIVDGLENFPETLLKLFSGDNFGKLITKV
ncbi:MAG TPA: NADP-dependent oxidoreductase [Acidiphilium sp.]|jgi:NADPH-dependent curcumin reductase CurA|uniref:NADP-dependent oxidoreductase n=1 Tax=unclassified Acidiphilium TaxID=2617493 RepID=UPI000BD51243|nr:MULTISPECIES: NADP-dependent oxidoreductase [unclassified Acidiphilium]OYV55839.1 MAG: NADP-dependent oxidoreductase [Acidiphilium sp. 20-67-58]HQT60339.1 NADP-dependent oxidoreductase [Acidiphilium sp.]HQU11668.1 NADP-dependent oxidoreductase [Acidiphilium sp.]